MSIAERRWRDGLQIDGWRTWVADRSNGYDALAGEFMAQREQSAIGARTVRDWAKRLTPGGSVLDLGCGHGVPISRALIEAGLAVHGVDASSAMVAAFRQRFPAAAATCIAVEELELAEHTFDGVVAWGLMFLLPAPAQADLIHTVAGVLRPGGRFLFTSPWQACEWCDVLTGLQSISLGCDEYRRLVADAALTMEGEADDEGANHYYFVAKP